MLTLEATPTQSSFKPQREVGGVCVRGVGFGSFICGRADIIEINGTRDLTSDCILLYKETCDYKGEAHYWARSFRLLVERESVSTN